jgi:diacylglycerol kinase (ATP)
VGSLFARHLLRRGPLTPDSIRVRFDDEGPITGEFLVLFVTTLDKMALGMRPFWDDRPAPLRFTSVDFAHQHLLRAVPSFLRGKPNGVLKPENGYSSRNAHCIELELETGCMLDGEVVEPQPGTPIRLTAEQSVQFLCL